MANRYEGADVDLFKTKLDAVDIVVKVKVAEYIAALPEGADSDSLSNIIGIFQSDEVGTSVAMFWKPMLEELKRNPAPNTLLIMFVVMAIDVLTIMVHACAVERINKNHDNVHSKARASFGEQNIHRALYVFTNKQLKHRLEMKPKSFKSFITSCLDESEASDILSSLNTANCADYLPCEMRERDEDEEEEDDGDDDEADDDSGEVMTNGYIVPEGFVVVPIALDSTGEIFIPNAQAKLLYVLVCCDSLDWKLGKVEKFKPRAKTFNFEIVWNTDVVYQQLKLDMHYDDDESSEEDVAVPGNWIYLKKT